MVSHKPPRNPGKPRLLLDPIRRSLKITQKVKVNKNLMVDAYKLTPKGCHERMNFSHITYGWTNDLRLKVV